YVPDTSGSHPSRQSRRGCPVTPVTAWCSAADSLVGDSRMADFLIKTGDMLQVTVPPPAIVPQLVAPVPLLGTGMTVLVNNQPVCLQGDELPIALRAPLMYTAPPFVTPGMGTLTATVRPNTRTM